MQAGGPVLQADNHGYRYGDGLFETMKVIKKQIQLENYHFERLKSGMELLGFNVPVLFSQEKIRNEIIQLCLKNDCSKLARVRLSVSRGNGGVNDCDEKFQYLMESWPLNETINELNENGLIIDIYPDARKSMDKFSGLKSANYLPYLMAALWAKENRLNDALILNSQERICDATIANIFWIKDEIIYTPPLSEGCIAGVMRRHLIENLKNKGFDCKEGKLEIHNMETTDEVFLTNSISGIRWVKEFRNKIYTNKIIKTIFIRLIQTIIL